MQEPERRTVQASRRYVLEEGEDFYGVWDRESPGKPVETFPLTDTGLQEATRRFSQLTQQDFWARFGPQALRWALFGGLGVWIFTGLVLWIAYPVGRPVPPVGILESPSASLLGYPGWAEVTLVIENVAFRVWVAALAIMLAMRLLDRGRQPT